MLTKGMELLPSHIEVKSVQKNQSLPIEECGDSFSALSSYRSFVIQIHPILNKYHAKQLFMVQFTPLLGKKCREFLDGPISVQLHLKYNNYANALRHRVVTCCDISVNTQLAVQVFIGHTPQTPRVQRKRDNQRLY